MTNRSSSATFLGYRLYVMPCPYSVGEWKAALSNPDAHDFTNLEGPYLSREQAQKSAEQAARVNAATVGPPIPDNAHPIWDDAYGETNAAGS